MYACLAVTCHLHFWQNDRDFLRATVVTRGWNGYRNKSQHRKSTLEKKILPPFQQGFEPATFQSRVRCSNHWAIPAPKRQVVNLLNMSHFFFLIINFLGSFFVLKLLFWFVLLVCLLYCCCFCFFHCFGSNLKYFLEGAWWTSYSWRDSSLPTVSWRNVSSTSVVYISNFILHWPLFPDAM